MLVQDIHYAASYENAYAEAKNRYEEIRKGDDFSEEENVLPCRDDMAVVYTLVRREFRAGHTMFPMRRLLSLLHASGHQEISYIKLKFIIRIMQELQICEITEPVSDTYLFEFRYQTAKTNIEKSSILRKLRTQLRKS